MMLNPRTVVLTVVIASVIAPNATYAQTGFPPLSSDLLRVSVVTERPMAQPIHSRGPAVLTGALIGAGAALVITGFAAAKYGENEGGRFCFACMMQWSAITVPVGAGSGAGIGFAVASAHPTLWPGSRLPRRAVGMTISARF